uniref:Uncharacterized protein n=1 Tax=Trichogramma kaykai TaxID=54128 RepID=A0ABD2XFD1_9HYME
MYEYAPFLTEIKKKNTYIPMLLLVLLLDLVSFCRGRKRLYNISARRASLHVNAAVMMDNARGYRLRRGSIAQIGERARI